MNSTPYQPDEVFPSIPGYSIIQSLARGASASVYLAVQTNFDRQVALKVMAVPAGSDGQPDRPGFSENFIREAQIAARLAHPNIITVYDMGQHEDQLYIAMEYHSGGDLKQRLQANMTTKRAMVILRQMATALEYAHGRGYIHRDVKPENILFSDDGRAILTDFGIAQASQDSTQPKQLSNVPGTPQYMSPEQVRGGALDARSDLYSLGIVFYEMLMGSPPFDEADTATIGGMHLNHPVPVLPTDLSTLQGLLDRLLAKDIVARYPSCRELIVDIDQLRMGAIKNQKLNVLRPIRATQEDRVTHVRTVIPTKPPEEPAAARSPKPAASAAGPSQRPSAQSGRRNWSKRALAALAVGGGLFYLQASGLLPQWIDAAAQSEQPQLRAAALRLQGWLEPEATTENDTENSGWLQNFGQEEGLRIAPTTREARIYELSAAALGSAVSSQLYPGRLDDALFAANTAAVLVTIDPETLAPIDPQQRLINRLIAQALSLEEASQQTEPADDNAVDLYREVLDLDAGNDEATAGLERIAQQQVERARQAIAVKSWDDARRTLEEATGIAPELSTIAETEAQLETAYQAEQARLAENRAQAAAAEQAQANRADVLLNRFKITGLLKKAEYDLAAGRYASPTGNNALQKYQEVLRLSPNNASALRGLQRLEQRIVADLDAAITAQDEEQVRTLLEQLSRIAPTHPRLQTARPAG